MSDYAAFLAAKAESVPRAGVEIGRRDVHDSLYEWQAEIVCWACQVGRAAIWADTGLGKSRMQIEFARIMAGDDGIALIVAPLAVCAQTVREAAAVDVDVRYVRSGDEMAAAGVYITNYEMVERFDAARLWVVVLDEASIIKQSAGAMRTLLIEHFAAVSYRLTCTATPAPNEPEELTNQAAFLGVMTRANMLAAYFVHDQDGWRPKGHARGPMFKWMASWALAIRKPSDLGYDDDGYDLPGLEIVPHLLPVGVEAEGQLFATELGGVGGRARVRRDTMSARCARAAELVMAAPGEPWIVWCGLNDEQEHLARIVGDRGYSITGSQSPEEKVDSLNRWLDGERPILLTKTSIAGMGINAQHCARMVFVGLSDSYEAYYQAIRRCYRYGQQHAVVAHVVLSEIEAQIAVNIARKEREASRVTAELVEAMRAHHNMGRITA